MSQRFLLGASAILAGGALFVVAAACGGDDPTSPPSPLGSDGAPDPPDGEFAFNDAAASDGGDLPCTTGLCAQRVVCPPSQDTTLEGTVYDPAGQVPLPGAILYIPNEAVPDLGTGVTCDRCTNKLGGRPVPGTITSTDVTGHFSMTSVPVGKAIPLVIQIGKWRRVITIANVPACQTTRLIKEHTRLPRFQSEGNIPHMAITTGAADTLECLLIRMGVDPREFTVKGKGNGRIHLYAGYGNTAYPAVATSALDDGTPMPQAEQFWSTAANLAEYDAVILSCEGNRNADGLPYGSRPDSKPASARAAMYSYLDQGGRVFASHWHDVWFVHPTDPGYKVADWDAGTYVAPEPQAVINRGFFKGNLLHDWLKYIGAIVPPADTLPLHEAHGNVTGVHDPYATAWITVPPMTFYGYPFGGSVEFLSFNTPVDAPDEQKCGRAVYSDLHVSFGTGGTATQDNVGATFPKKECALRPLTPQEKALEFLLFDVSSCVTADQRPPPPPH